MAGASYQTPTTLRARGRVARRQSLSRGSTWVLLFATLLGLFILVFLGFDTIRLGGDRVSWDFLTHYPSRFEERAGIRSPLLGTVWVVGVTVMLSVPVAVSTAIWMEEFAPKGRFLSLVKLNIANLAGVPGIIYGILGLAIFVRGTDLGPTVIAAALTLSLMVLPMIVIASSEAIRQVPPSLRDGSLALGATKWQTVWHHVLPGAMPGIMTGTILAVSRAAGEAAVLIMVGSAGFIARDPDGLKSRFTVMPTQIYDWTVRAGDLFKTEAAAAIIVLMVFVLSLNLIAVLIRERFRRS
jgi:phosphate transport system permease protein